MPRDVGLVDGPDPTLSCQLVDASEDRDHVSVHQLFEQVSVDSQAGPYVGVQQRAPLLKGRAAAGSVVDHHVECHSRVGG